MVVLTLFLALAMQDAPKPAQSEQGREVPDRVVPAPAPSPVQAQSISRKATPRGSPQNWVTNADYPAPALRAGQSGITSFRLVLDEAGEIRDCIITGSSGSELLDFTTCSLLRRRAAFNPAHDGDGNPVPSEWPSRFRWVLPAPRLRPVVSWTGTLRFTITPAGKISDCAHEVIGTPDEEYVCAGLSSFEPAQLLPLRGSSTGPVRILIRIEHMVDRMATPASAPLEARFGEIVRARRTFGVDADGRMFDCRLTRSDQGDPDSKPCLTDFRYDPDGKTHRVTIRGAVFTDGDRNIRLDQGFLRDWGN